MLWKCAIVCVNHIAKLSKRKNIKKRLTLDLSLYPNHTDVSDIIGMGQYECVWEVGRI